MFRVSNLQLTTIAACTIAIATTIGPIMASLILNLTVGGLIRPEDVPWSISQANWPIDQHQRSVANVDQGRSRVIGPRTKQLMHWKHQLPHLRNPSLRQVLTDEESLLLNPFGLPTL